MPPVDGKEDQHLSLETLHLMIQERDSQYRQRFLDVDAKYQGQFVYQKEAVATALSAAKEAVSSALAAAKEAVTKAENASEKRFESINEFRGTLQDQTRTFIPRQEAEIRFKAMDDQFNALASRVNHVSEKQIQGSGKMEGAQALWAALAAVVVIGLAIGGFVLNYGR